MHRTSRLWMLPTLCLWISAASHAWPDDESPAEPGKAEPKRTAPRTPAEARIESALNLRRLQKFDEALALLKEARALNPPPKVAVDTLYRSGETWFRKGQAALEEKVAGVDPGACFREAIQHFGEAVKAFPQEPAAADCVYMTGSAHLMLGELDKAMAEYGKAYTQYPAFDRRHAALTRVAVCQAGLDDPRGARATFARVLQEFPSQTAQEKTKLTRYLEELRLVGRAAPEIHASKWIEGLVGPEGIKTFDGEVMVLVFFATWCDHCRAELPSLRKLMDEWSAKGVTFLGVCDPDDPKMVEPVDVYVKKHRLPFLDVALDSGNRTNRAYAVNGFPAGVLIDRKGMVRWRGHMAFFSRGLLARAVDEK